MTLTPRIVEVRQNVLKKNDILARALRERFQASGVYVVNLVSSPGAGKTTALTHILTELSTSHRVAAIVGDLATENDAERLRESGADVRQITTGTVCHLEAQMVEEALHGWLLDTLDFLFIENVGNLVCPASYDLGEHERVVLFSVTEGEDKPEKYPTLINSSDTVIVTKMDLAEAVDFNRERFVRAVERVRPGIAVYEISAKTGAGLKEWANRLIEARNHIFPMAQN